MVIIDRSVIPSWVEEVQDESDNFIMLLAPSPIFVEHVEELFGCGLDVRGVTPTDGDRVTICCRKV